MAFPTPAQAVHLSGATGLSLQAQSYLYSEPPFLGLFFHRPGRGTQKGASGGFPDQPGNIYEQGPERSSSNCERALGEAYGPKQETENNGERGE